MRVAYGIKISDMDDPYITTAEEAMDGLAQAGIPGKYLVDFIPILKYVPSWMPGADFKRKAAHWARVNTVMADRPFDHVKETLVSSALLDWSRPRVDICYTQRQGTAAPSVAATLIEALPNDNDERRAEEETVAKDVMALSYVGKIGSTLS